MNGIQVKESLVQLGQVCSTEKDIRTVAKLFSESFLTEFRSVDLAVFSKKLSVFAEELRAISEEQAYAFASTQPKGEDVIVDGCKITTARPTNVYQYTETVQLAEEDMKRKHSEDKELLKAMKKLEEKDGTAVVVDIKKGNLNITIPKGDK